MRAFEKSEIIWKTVQDLKLLDHDYFVKFCSIVSDICIRRIPPENQIDPN